MIQDPLNDGPLLRKDIQSKIDQHGCYIVLVEADNYLPAYAYTIGIFQKFHLPEIICFGLSIEHLGNLLNIACELMANGTSLQPGILYDDFLKNYSVQFLSVDKEYHSDYMAICNIFYYTDNYPSLQMVWPDKASLFPWEQGFNPDLQFMQPLLDRNTDFKFYESRNLGVYTTQHFLDGSQILYVYHDHDGVWQFYSEKEPDPSDGVLICLEEITRIDPSINQLYHLPYGKYAWRISAKDEWIIESSGDEE